MAIPIVAWLFQGIPESIAVTALVFSLGTERLHWRTIILVGMLQAISIYLVRLLPLNMYFHVIIAAVTLAFLCAKFGQIDIELSYIYSLVALLAVLIFEFGFMYLADYFHIITYAQFLSDVKLRILVGLPQVIGVLLLALFISRHMQNGRLRLFSIELKLLRAKKGTSKRNMVNVGELK